MTINNTVDSIHYFTRIFLLLRFGEVIIFVVILGVVELLFQRKSFIELVLSDKSF